MRIPVVVLTCSILGSAIAAGDESLPPPEAIKLIDAAALAVKRVPAYVATSHEESGKNSIVTTLYVRNDTDGVRLVRAERSLTVAGSKPQMMVRVINRDGIWQLNRARVLHFGYPVKLERTIPTRFVTPAKIRMLDGGPPAAGNDDLNCTIDRAADFFGRPAERLTISLSARSIDELKNPDSPLRRKIAQQIAKGVSAREKDDSEGLANPERAVEALYPATYVYFIDKVSRIILSWQVFSFSGAKIVEASIQDLQLPDSLDDALFSVPLGVPVVELQSPSDYSKNAETRPNHPASSAAGSP